MLSQWFDSENNFISNDEEQSNRINRLRLQLAAEFLRCKSYVSHAAIDQAIDDADTALGFLFRNGYISEWNV